MVTSTRRLGHLQSGTGKSLAAEVIGYETGSTLKVVNMAEVRPLATH